MPDDICCSSSLNKYLRNYLLYIKYTRAQKFNIAAQKIKLNILNKPYEEIFLIYIYYLF